jgi:hypothetical protein
MENTRRNLQFGGLIALAFGLGIAAFEANRVYNSPVKTKAEVTEEQAREEKYHAAAGIASTILALGGALISYAAFTSGSSKLTSYRRPPTSLHSPPAPQH